MAARLVVDGRAQRESDGPGLRVFQRKLMDDRVSALSPRHEAAQQNADDGAAQKPDADDNEYRAHGCTPLH